MSPASHAPRWYSAEAARLFVVHEELELARRHAAERRERLATEVERLMAQGWSVEDVAGCLAAEREDIERLLVPEELA